MCVYFGIFILARLMVSVIGSYRPLSFVFMYVVAQALIIVLKYLIVLCVVNV